LYGFDRCEAIDWALSHLCVNGGVAL
jgi:hypothetical protein